MNQRKLKQTGKWSFALCVRAHKTNLHILCVHTQNWPSKSFEYIASCTSYSSIATCTLSSNKASSLSTVSSLQWTAKSTPTVGLSDSEWRKKLQSFVNGQFSFGRGERFRKGSKWLQRLEAIKICPKQRNVTVDVFGRKLSYNCGFYSSVVSTLTEHVGFGSVEFSSGASPQTILWATWVWPMTHGVRVETIQRHQGAVRSM